MPNKISRQTDELIILAMTGAGSFAIFPFAITRLLQGDFVLAALDMVIVVGMATLAIYVYKTHKTDLAGMLVALLAVTSIVGTVYIKGVGQIYWMFPALLVVFYLLPPMRAVLLSFLALTLLVPVLLTTSNSMELMTILSTIGLTIAFAFAFSTQTTRQRDQLVHLATKDPLTGAGNRRALGQKLREIIAQHERDPVVASILILDLDHFKGINDKYGHAAGDTVLVGLVRVILQRIRETDSVYRIGGEEFLVVSERLDENAAQLLGEDLRVLVSAARLAENHAVTVSVGVAQLGAGENSDDWLRRGDDALYDAKHQGRDRVVTQSTCTFSELDIARIERDAANKPVA